MQSQNDNAHRSCLVKLFIKTYLRHRAVLQQFYEIKPSDAGIQVGEKISCIKNNNYGEACTVMRQDMLLS